MKYSELKKEFKNKYVIRIAAGALTIALLGTSYGAYQVNAAKATDTESVSEESTEKSDSEQKIEKQISSMVSSKQEEEIGKEETVYLIADASGKVNQTIVSDWLTNSDNEDTIKDASDLTDITNVKGDETFTQDGNNITWNADGNDIFYQGTTTKEAPVSEKITYYLDGEEIAPEDLAGKSGKVTMRFDYTNTEKSTQTIDGEKTDIYVPFSVLTGMVLDDSFSNIEVTNGKVVSDGENSVVVGIATPGLKESLGVDEGDFDEDVDFPDYVEVTADVKDFAMEMTVTVATSSLISELSLNGDLDLSTLSDTIDEMTDASSQLVDGSGTLSDGLDTLNSKLKEFSSGVGTLQSSVSTYTSGVQTLDEGLSTLNSGAATLADGANTLSGGATTISNGIATLDQELKESTVLSDTKKAELKTQVEAAIDAGFADDTSASSYNNIKSTAADTFYNTLTADANISGVSTQISTALSANTDLLNVLKAGVKTTIQNTIRSAYAAQITALESGYGYTEEQAIDAIYQTGNSGTTIDQAVEATVASTVNTLSSQMASSVVTGIAAGAKDSVGEAVASTAQTAAKTAAVTAAESAVVSGADEAKSTISAAINAEDATSGQSLVSGSAALATGAQQLVANVPTLTSGVTQLLTGANTLAANNDALNGALTTLSSSTTQLADGVSQLDDGASDLADGMEEFDEEAIQKLADTYNGDVKSLLDRADAIMQAGEDYTTFSDVADGVNGSVKFIIKTDSIKADK